MKAPILKVLSISLVLILALTTVGFGNGTKKKTDQKAEREEAKKKTDLDEKAYLLRYRFEQGEVVRWEIFRHGQTKTTVSGTTQTSEFTTKSTKVWKIIKVNKDGSFVFENQTEDVDMWHKMTDCEEVHYNSKESKKPPHGFEGAAERIGKPLARMTLDSRGNVKKRVELVKEHEEDEKISPVTIPLPKEAIPVGHVWHISHDVYVALESGLTKKVLINQAFTFKEVKNDIATISVDTQVMTPIHNPEIKVKLINQYMRNTIRFDIKLGRVVLQEQNLDKKVIGFRGPDSRTHYLVRFTEKLKTLK